MSCLLLLVMPVLIQKSPSKTKVMSYLSIQKRSKTKTTQRLHNLQACQWGILVTHWLQRIYKWIGHRKNFRSWYSNATCNYKITCCLEHSCENKSPQKRKFCHWTAMRDVYVSDGISGGNVYRRFSVCGESVINHRQNNMR